jgi:hypothetical protein
VARWDNAAVLIRNFFGQQTNLVHFFLQLIQRGQTDQGDKMRGKLSERIEGPSIEKVSNVRCVKKNSRSVNVQDENDGLDNDTLFDKDLLMVDGELRGQKWDDSASQSVVAEFRSVQTVEVVELNSTLDLHEIIYLANV